MKNIILTILLTVAIWSCKTRKVDISKSEVLIETAKESVVKEHFTTESNLVQKESVSEWVEVFTAIDSLKPIVIDGKTYFNAVLTRKKVNSTKDTKENKSEVKTVDKSVKEKEVTGIKEKTKKVDSQPLFVNYEWILFLAFVLFLIIYWVWKKYKDKLKQLASQVFIK